MLRYERKYLVPNELMNQLRTRIKPFVVYDKHIRPSESGLMQYTVRSIYFDNHSLDFYDEKRAGLLLRRKFRIRGYNTFEPDKKVVFEIKRKIEDRIKKHRSYFRYDHVEDVLNSGSVDKYIINTDQCEIQYDDANRFLYHVKKDSLHPSVLIVYEREAWHGKFDHGVRITFDKNIRSIQYPTMDMLFEDGIFSYVFDRHFVLEIKYFTPHMPVWARSLVGEFGLRHEAISKYTQGYDASSQRKMITF